MAFCLVKTNWRLLSLAAALAALPLAAQQSVDLSAPLEAPPGQGPAFEAHEIHGPEGLKPGSSSLFTPGKPLPFYDKMEGSPAPPPMSPEQAAQMRKALDNQKNWTLLTPEEIMGIPNERAIFGLPAADDDNNLTADQRFLKRLDARNQTVANGGPATDGDQPNGDDSSQNGLFGPKSDKVLTDIWGRKIDQNGAADPDRQRDPIWNSAFAHPPVAPKPDAQQQAEMERFRILLGSVQPVKPAQPAQTLQPIAPAPDPNMEQLPVFNPNGNSFTALKDTIYKPTGIMPLPGIATRPLENKKPESITKLPPWLSNQAPPPGTAQRVF